MLNDFINDSLCRCFPIYRLTVITVTSVISVIKNETPNRSRQLAKLLSGSFILYLQSSHFGGTIKAETEITLIAGSKELKGGHTTSDNCRIQLLHSGQCFISD